MIGSVLRQEGLRHLVSEPAASVYDAIAMMADKQVGPLLVIADGKLVGVISERDCARRLILQGQSSKETGVQDIMTSSVIFVTPKYTVDDCMRIMTDTRLRHLPVIEDEKVVGVVSIGDLVKSIIAAQDETIHHLQGYISGKYPG